MRRKANLLTQFRGVLCSISSYLTRKPNGTLEWLLRSIYMCLLCRSVNAQIKSNTKTSQAGRTLGLQRRTPLRTVSGSWQSLPTLSSIKIANLTPPYVVTTLTFYIQAWNADTVDLTHFTEMPGVVGFNKWAWRWENECTS